MGERQVTKPERSAESLGQYPFKVSAFPHGQPPFHCHFILLLERKPFLHSIPPPELLVIASHSVSPITLDSYMRITHPARCLNQRTEEKSPWEACRASSCVGPGQLNFSLLLGSAPGLIKPLLSFRFPRLLRAKGTTAFACLDGLSAFFGPLNSRLGQEGSEGGPHTGSTCFQPPPSCPAKADLHPSDTWQIRVGQYCPGSRPPLLLLLPQPWRQPDLHTKSSLVNPMPRLGSGFRGWDLFRRRAPQSLNLRVISHSLSSGERSSNQESAEKSTSWLCSKWLPSSHCFRTELLLFL